MNEESSLPAETGDRVPAESSALEVEATDPSLVSETMIPVETERSLADWFTDPTEVTEAIDATPYYDVQPEETVAETVAPVTVNLIEELRSDIVFSNLCSSFLICGTLVGSIIFRKIYGT